jgi:transposase
VDRRRAAELIERHFKIRFHPEHVREMLKRRLKWTSQKPQKKARERDEAALAP